MIKNIIMASEICEGGPLRKATRFQEISFCAKCINSKFIVFFSIYLSQFGQIIDTKQIYHFMKLKMCQIKHDQVNGKQKLTHFLRWFSQSASHMIL